MENTFHRAYLLALCRRERFRFTCVWIRFKVSKQLFCCWYHLLNTARRYRQISTFACDTIRKFAQNSSEMKKLAARDFEDLLQVWRPLSQCMHFFTHKDGPIVCNSHIWGPSRWTTQRPSHEVALSNGRMARPCQTSNAYWDNAGFAWSFDVWVWQTSAKLSRAHMLAFCTYGAFSRHGCRKEWLY